LANEVHLKIIKQGVIAWNAWREAHSDITPDLRAADLSGAELTGGNFEGANLEEANLKNANLRKANFERADLTGAHLQRAQLRSANLEAAKLYGTDFLKARLIGANLQRTDLRRANLAGAHLGGANLSGTDLRETNLGAADLLEANLDEADFSGVHISGVNFSEATLRSTNLSNAVIHSATFGDNDLSTVKGLATVCHIGPSTIGIDTLFRSDGKIPEVFLRGAGVPEDFITFLPSLIGSSTDFYSCFISYSHEDEEFSRHLHLRMRGENLRVWYAAEHMKGGKKLHEEIFRAIQAHDKLLLVLSENSMKSEWVKTEIRRARKVEREENRRKLFPIRLIDFGTIEKWECFDADSGKDLGVEVREYYIPDFSNWKDHDSFELEFEIGRAHV